MTNYNSFMASLHLLSEDIFSQQDSKWLDVICQGNNAALLQDNAFNLALRNSASLYLVSAVDYKDNLGSIQAGMGCLGNVIYCVQAYKESSQRYALHNFGSTVMRHRSAQEFIPILFEMKTKDLQVGRINYLRMGELFYTIQQKSDFANNPRTIDDFEGYRLSVQAQSDAFLQYCLARFDGNEIVTTVEDAHDIVNAIASTIQAFKSLAYIYFESVSLALLLRSSDDYSVLCREKAEFNHSLYIELVHELKAQSSKRLFASYEFCPDADQLISALVTMNRKGTLSVDVPETLCHIANCILFYIGNCFNTNQAIIGNIFYDFCKIPRQSAYLSDKLDGAVASMLREYSRRHKYDIVINSAIEKGEIGISIDVPSERIKITQARYGSDKSCIIKVRDLHAKLLPIENFQLPQEGGIDE